MSYFKMYLKMRKILYIFTAIWFFHFAVFTKMPIAKFVTIQRCRNKMSERAGRQLRSIFYELLMSGVINHCVCIVSKELFMTRLPLFFLFFSLRYMFCFSWFSHDFKEETKDHSIYNREVSCSTFWII